MHHHYQRCLELAGVGHCRPVSRGRYSHVVVRRWRLQSEQLRRESSSFIQDFTRFREKRERERKRNQIEKIGRNDRLETNESLQAYKMYTISMTKKSGEYVQMNNTN